MTAAEPGADGAARRDDALAVAAWRREVHALYADVRAIDDPPTAHAVWVDRRARMFRDHPASARLRRQELRHAAYDPAFRFMVTIEPAPAGTWEYPTGTDGTVAFERIGRVTLGTLGRLDVWWLTSYGGGLFLPMRDATAGGTTYGAGRYLLDTAKGADLGRGADTTWVVDLNFVYNPSCAYNPRWACPLAGEGNRLSAQVPVGELLPHDPTGAAAGSEVPTT